MLQIEVDPCVNVTNPLNSEARWKAALEIYQQTSDETRSGRSPGRITMNTLIDVSASMDGTKLIAVKLGLCALLAHLDDDDTININAFSDRTWTITNGFQNVGVLKLQLPALLERLKDHGSTACYDATITGILELCSQCSITDVETVDSKRVVVVLTGISIFCSVWEQSFLTIGSFQMEKIIAAEQLLLL